MCTLLMPGTADCRWLSCGRPGLQVLKTPLSALGRRWEVRHNELLSEVPLSAGREVTTTFRAEPEHAYAVIPYGG